METSGPTECARIGIYNIIVCTFIFIRIILPEPNIDNFDANFLLLRCAFITDAEYYNFQL